MEGHDEVRPTAAIMNQCATRSSLTHAMMDNGYHLLTGQDWPG